MWIFLGNLIRKGAKAFSPKKITKAINVRSIIKNKLNIRKQVKKQFKKNINIVGAIENAVNPFNIKSPTTLAKEVANKRIRSTIGIITRINDVLNESTNFKIDIPERLIEFVKSPNLIKALSMEEIAEIEALAKATLERNGINSESGEIEDITDVALLEVARQTFLNNYKTRFYDSDITVNEEVVDGDAKDDLWAEIEASYKLDLANKRIIKEKKV